MSRCGLLVVEKNLFPFPGIKSGLSSFWRDPIPTELLGPYRTTAVSYGIKGIRCWALLFIELS
jgi:hypothetical protein